MSERKPYISWSRYRGECGPESRIVWHTDEEVVLLGLKHGNLNLNAVPKDKWPEMEKYNHQREDDVDG